MSLQISQDPDNHLSDSNGEDHTRKVVYIGIVFMLWFSAMNSAASLMTEILDQDGYPGLGQITLALAYIVFAVGMIFVPKIKAHLTHKQGLIIATAVIMFLFLTGAHDSACAMNGDHSGFCSTPAVYIMTLSAGAIGGMGLCLLWVSQGGYINDCVNETNVGKLNGIFWSLTQASLLLGAVIATVVLTYTNHVVYFFVCTGLTIVALVMLFFLPEVQLKPTSMIPFMTWGQALDMFLENFKDSQIRRVLPLMANSGLVFAFYATMIPAIIVKIFAGDTVQRVNEYSALFLVIVGFTEFSVGFIAGRLADNMKKLYVMNGTNIIYQAAIMIAFVALFTMKYGWIIVGGFVFGMAECSTYVINTSLLGSDFEGRVEVITLFWFMQGAAGALGFAMTATLNGVTLIIPMLIFLVVQLTFNPIINSYHPKLD